MKPNDTWKVLPHGPITRLADNLHIVAGTLRMPLGETTRHMTIVELEGGRLAIHSAIALVETEMRRLDALGDVAFLIVPSGIHRLDIRPWKARYPGASVVAPEGARDRVEEVVRVDHTHVDLGDPRVRLEDVAGTARRELAMIVESSTGVTLVLNDIVFNLPEVDGIAGVGLRALGFGPGHPSMPKLVQRKLVADGPSVRAQLRAWADLDRLERIIVAHGDPIERPQAVLRELAAA